MLKISALLKEKIPAQNLRTLFFPESLIEKLLINNYQYEDGTQVRTALKFMCKHDFSLQLYSWSIF